MTKFCVQIRKKAGLTTFGFLSRTGGGGGLKNAATFDSREEAENAATTFILVNPEYVDRLRIRPVEGHMNDYVKARPLRPIYKVRTR